LQQTSTYRWARVSDQALAWHLRRNCSVTPRQLGGWYATLCLLSLLIGSGFWVLGMQLNLHPPGEHASPSSSSWLHWFMLIICVVIFVAVFGVMFYSILKHRKSVRATRPANFHESVAVEIAWTVVPFIIVIGMALRWPPTVVAHEGHHQRRPHHQGHRLPVEVGLRLPQGRGRGHRLPVHAGRPRTARCPTPASPKGDDYLLKVDNPLVVPVDKKIRIITTANDVIHAWMVPAFGVKQDAIPGFVRDTWFRAEKTGDFYGQCAELCGKEHAYMPIHVKVLSQADYAAWVEGQEEGNGRARPTTRQGLDAGRAGGPRREGLQRQLRRLPPADGKGAGPIKPLDGSAIVLDADKAKQIAILLKAQQRRDAGLEAAVRHRAGGRHHLHQEQLEQQDRQLVQPAELVAARKFRRAVFSFPHAAERGKDPNPP
jgi:cytochrome c oxidase subunit 2